MTVADARQSPPKFRVEVVGLLTLSESVVSVLQEVVRLETQYWALVEVPKQEKQEPVPAYVLRACATLEKTQKPGEGVKTSAKLAEEDEKRRERLDRLESKLTLQFFFSLSLPLSLFFYFLSFLFLSFFLLVGFLRQLSSGFIHFSSKVFLSILFGGGGGLLGFLFQTTFFPYEIFGDFWSILVAQDSSQLKKKSIFRNLFHLYFSFSAFSLSLSQTHQHFFKFLIYIHHFLKWFLRDCWELKTNWRTLRMNSWRGARLLGSKFRKDLSGDSLGFLSESGGKRAIPV